ncbi:MAG: ATP synthase F1 subunit gamma [Ruminococcaceae bacterium]|nr:ATP synthase F1 subunit gamma [Oscillospiraceae bacterium]
MGADTKKLRNRIKSVDSTLHLTRAMGLVASSKMRRALEGMNKGRQYEAAVWQAIAPLTQSPECQNSPYMKQAEGGRTCLIVIAGDRGLAGGYNANVFRALREYEDVDIIPIGKRACDRFHGELCRAEGFDAREALGLSLDLCRKFREGEYSRVGILGTRYLSMLSQQPDVRWVLPLTKSEESVGGGMIYEPDELTILEAAVPEYVAGILVSAARESFACEIVARRTAMDSAGKNAQEMIDKLQLEYNRARQSAITQEITEIVAGSGT